MKQKILTLTVFLFISFLSFGQGTQITGVVKAASDGLALPGVNIIVKGTTNGVQTDFDGNYTITASPGDVLVFSYLGMADQEATVGSDTVINVNLQEDAEQLEDVVVTALGISKAKKSLTYSAQEVDGDELNKIKQTNPINSLSGKVSGVTISRSSSGLGGATKVVLRGSSSTTNNDPLYVIDGIPMLNNGNGQNGESAGTNIFGSQTGNRDGGDAFSLLNPDDIESMTVLKGASAAALYGSQGANGVILITTKKGKEGQLTVNYNSSITIDNVISLPELQTEYQSASVGQPIAANGRVADAKSWGARTGGLSNTVDDFFETGYTSIQSLSLSAGNQKAQTYFSYANTVAGGVMPNNSMIRNNITLRENAKFLKDKINVSASITLSDQRIRNRPTNGLYSNPLTGLYLNPVGIDLNTYKNFEYFNAETNMMDQYASSFDENIQQNPYWLLNRNIRKDIAQRVLANVSVKYQITDDFSLQSRGSLDKSFFTFDQRISGGSDPTFASATGRYVLEKTENTQQYIDLIGTYNKQLSEDFTFTGVLGTSLTKYETGDRVFLDSGKNPGLKYPNVFTIANFSDTNNIQQSISNREVQSIFGSVNLGYKEMLFLDITGRSDWSSTLAFTDTNSFFYPSVGLTGILTEMTEFPEFVSFGKVRTSYAVVGKDIPAYASNQLEPIELGTGNASVPRFGVIEGETLEPEEQKSFEIGTEWRFLQNRLGFDFTYYSTTTTNQIFFIAAEPNIAGLTQNIVNAGEISNKGIELTLNARPIVTDNFKWNTAVNFATNKNEVVSVHPSLNNGEAILTASGVNGYGYSLIEGEDFGSIRASSLLRNANGTPIVSAGDLTLQTTGKDNTVAHAQPDYTLGWNNTFDYKDFSLNILVDAKVGGDVLSVTEAVNDKYGVSQASADARNTNGGMIDVVDTNGAPAQITAQAYYNAVGGRDGILGEYVYSATNINVREVSLGYNMNLENSFIQNIKVSLIANNLFFIYKDAPFDPNIASSTGIGLQGVDIFGQPSTRSIGLNLNVKF